MAASCDQDVYVTWLYGTGGMRLTRIGRTPLRRADALTTPPPPPTAITTDHVGSFRSSANVTISTVKALASKSHPEAESYDQYSYLQEPWRERWSRDVPDGSVVYLFGNHLVVLSGSLLITVDITTGMFRRELTLGEPRQPPPTLTSACHAAGSDYMYVIGHDPLERGRTTTVWCIEMGILAIDWTSALEDQVATVCDATPDDQRVYVAGDFGLAQLDSATGAGVWIVETIPVSALVSDRFGNAVVLSNSPEEDTVTIELVERLTGRRHVDAIAPDSAAWPLFRFLDKYHLYIMLTMTIVMVLNLCFAACLLMRRSRKTIGAAVPLTKQRLGRGAQRRPRFTKLQSPPCKPRGLATGWEDKKQTLKCQDMDPLLRSNRNFV